MPADEFRKPWSYYTYVFVAFVKLETGRTCSYRLQLILFALQWQFFSKIRKGLCMGKEYVTRVCNGREGIIRLTNYVHEIVDRRKEP